jgi:hypothetical protein
MDAIATKCLKCGDPLKEPRKLKFCSYSCRGQHAVETLAGVPHEGARRRSKSTRRNKALRSLRKHTVGAFTFERINSVTIRIDRRGKNGLGWLTEVARRWIARVGNRGSEPLSLEDAKRAAIALLRERGNGEHFDWIAKINQIAANEVDRAYWTREKRKWPANLMGGSKRTPRMQVEPEQRQAIMNAEQVLKDDTAAPTTQLDYPLEYHEDGYPELPACLDRTPKPELLAEAA